MPAPPASPRVTRIAPSPTGALHLGNARTFLINWAMARQACWRIVLRIEDLDGPRIKTGAAEAAIDTLRWLGMDWDEGPHDQLADLEPYRRALRLLARKRLLYPCRCTRAEIASAQSAPHDDEHELRYPGSCRPDPAAWPELDIGHLPPDTALRVIAPDSDVAFTDRIAGPQRFNVQRQVGDFLVAAKASLPAYQLAVVVDDARQGVTDVVRGDDLLRSTARQLLLYRDLELSPEPDYHHIPLVLGPDSRRLAKRHGDTRISTYREAGVPAERIIAWIARTSGVTGDPVEMNAGQFAENFRIDRLPPGPVVFTAEDHRWLTAGSGARMERR